MSRQRPLFQVSAGGVVFKKSATGIRVCLIGRRMNGQIVWGLPKGHVEKNESLEQTALREVREETGISGSTLSPLGFIQYSFFDLESKKRIFKTVHFFLICYLKGKLNDHDDEVEFVRWYSAKEALNRAEYPSERQVLRKAIGKLKQHK
ncbi:MAG: NUDIX hydrolase [Candidatus Omnitrophica bacterium]|nr:NUDIX hydrolase [Candidatus Omnitrophota bacterium]